MKVIFAAEIYKGYWRNDHFERGERVRVVTMPERLSAFEDDD